MMLACISFVLLAFALACSGTAVAGSIVCYECTNVSNMSECHTTRECPQYHSCFTSVSGQGSSAVFTLGCRHSDHCPSTHQLPGGNPIIGRSVVSAACNQCCNVDVCNRNLCSMTTHALGTDTGQCIDDTTFDCQSTAAHFNFCALTEQAITVCRKFCGLCSRNGSWSEWGQWSICDVTCGSGHMTRHRSCTHPAPAHGGLDCEDSATDTKPCKLPLCPVHGGWTLWSPWGSCSATCGVGLRRRDRSCTNPNPSHGGDHCIGDARDDKVCMDQPCADGEWTAWGAWGHCSASCGPGFKTRIRSCTNPPPSPFGHDCVGLIQEVAACNDTTCQDGVWTAWGAWGHCSTSCGPGFKTRARSCTNPPPSPFGHDCVGLMQEIVACNGRICPVIHGGWSSWSQWSTNCTCISRYGYGTCRTRTCTNPAPSATGHVCIGNSEVTTDCNEHCVHRGQICLVNGTHTSGRVELLVNGTWSTLCKDNFHTDLAAAFLCTLLGFRNNATLAAYGHFGAGTGPIILKLSDIDESGGDLKQSSHAPVGQHGCHHDEDVGIFCA